METEENLNLDKIHSEMKKMPIQELIYMQCMISLAIAEIYEEEKNVNKKNQKTK